jgi:hypothetical protein
VHTEDGWVRTHTFIKYMKQTPFYEDFADECLERGMTPEELLKSRHATHFPPRFVQHWIDVVNGKRAVNSHLLK